jgi:ornithine decarboxylase
MAPSIDVVHHDSQFDINEQTSQLEINHVVKTSTRTHLINHASTELISNAMKCHISDIDHEDCDAGEEDSFFVCDLGEVITSFNLWKQMLPQITPHYAVKCNTNIEVIKLLARLGTGFDCASKSEIDTILALGISPSKIIYANPCKTNSFIRHANEKNVNFTTVDNCQELYKIQKHHEQCGILIRIATDDEDAQCRLSTKFGCSLSEAVNSLLPLAKELQLKVKGVAFHVGSGAKDFGSIFKAVRDSRVVFDKGIELGFEMDLLDIGGGFERDTFLQSSKVVNDSLNQFFPADFQTNHNVRIIAEPGRFMVSNAFTLGCHIIARRDVQQDGLEAMIYINDGVYGNMNCILFDHQHPKAYVLSHANKFYYHEEIENEQVDGRHQFSIWGPTCDGLDCVSNRTELSRNVQVGDWLFFPNLGAYTSAACTTFNGLGSSAKTIYVNSAE